MSEFWQTNKTVFASSSGPFTSARTIYSARRSSVTGPIRPEGLSGASGA